MKDKQLLKSGFALLDGHVEKVGNFRMEPPSLFRGRGKHPRTGSGQAKDGADRVAINVGRDRAPPRCHEPGDRGVTCNMMTVLLGSRRGTRTRGLGVRFRPSRCVDTASTLSS